MKNVITIFTALLIGMFSLSSSAHAKDIGKPTSEKLVMEVKQIAKHSIPRDRSTRDVISAIMVNNKIGEQKMQRFGQVEKVPTKRGRAEFIVMCEDHYDPPMQPETKFNRYKVSYEYYFFLQHGKLEVMPLQSTLKYKTY